MECVRENQKEAKTTRHPRKRGVLGLIGMGRSLRTGDRRSALNSSVNMLTSSVLLCPPLKAGCTLCVWKAQGVILPQGHLQDHPPWGELMKRFSGLLAKESNNSLPEGVFQAR